MPIQRVGRETRGAGRSLLRNRQTHVFQLRDRRESGWMSRPVHQFVYARRPLAEEGRGPDRHARAGRQTQCFAPSSWLAGNWEIVRRTPRARILVARCSGGMAADDLVVSAPWPS